MQEKQDLSSIPRLGRCPGVGKGNPLQYSCLENSMDRRAWGGGTAHKVVRSRVHTHPHTHTRLTPEKRHRLQRVLFAMFRTLEFSVKVKRSRFCFVFKQKRKYFVKSFINHTSDTVLVCSGRTSKTFKTNEKNFSV